MNEPKPKVSDLLREAQEIQSKIDKGIASFDEYNRLSEIKRLYYNQTDQLLTLSTARRGA